MLCVHILLMLWCTPRSSSLGLRQSFPTLLECCLWMSRSWTFPMNYFAERERLLPSLNSLSGGSLFSGPISGRCEGTLPAAHLPPLSTLMGFQSSPPWDWQLHWSQLLSLPNSPPFTVQVFFSEQEKPCRQSSAFVSWGTNMTLCYLEWNYR